MKKLLLAMLSVLMLFSFTACNKKTVENKPETVILTVNGENVTQGDFDQIYEVQAQSPMFQALQGDEKQSSLMKLIMKDKIVNEIIVKKILLTEIEKRKIEVSEDEVKEYIDAIAKQVGSTDKFYEILSQQGLTKEQFDKMAQEDLKINKLIDSLSPAQVSDADVKKFYDENKTSKFTYPDQVRASHILIMAPTKEITEGIRAKNQGASNDEISKLVQEELNMRRAKAESIAEEAKAEKADFAALAKKYSEDTSNSQQGGDLGFFSKEQMVKPFSDKAFSMKPDTVSDVVQTEYGFHIIKVVDRKAAGVVPFDEAKQEIKNYLQDEEKVEVLKKLVDSQKANTVVIYLDQNYNPQKIQEEVKKITGEAGVQGAPQAPENVEQAPAEAQ